MKKVLTLPLILICIHRIGDLNQFHGFIIYITIVYKDISPIWITKYRCG